jgi:hypothetical protein
MLKWGNPTNRPGAVKKITICGKQKKIRQNKKMICIEEIELGLVSLVLL